MLFFWQLSTFSQLSYCNAEIYDLKWVNQVFLGVKYNLFCAIHPHTCCTWGVRSSVGFVLTSRGSRFISVADFIVVVFWIRRNKALIYTEQTEKSSEESWDDGQTDLQSLQFLLLLTDFIWQIFLFVLCCLDVFFQNADGQILLLLRRITPNRTEQQTKQ